MEIQWLEEKKKMCKAAQTILIKSVTSAILAYAMQTTKLNQKFFWGESDAQQKLHTIA